MNKKQFDILVFVGRFQPFHVEHKRIIDIAREKAKHVVVLVGSAGSARTIYNPFTYEERRSFISMNYPNPIIERGSEWGKNHWLHIRPLYDKKYNNTAWIKQVQDIVEKVAFDIANPDQVAKVFSKNTTKSLKIGLIGASKDHTSFYLKMFPQWGSVNVDICNEIHATDVRNMIFKEQAKRHEIEGSILPKNVCDFLFSNFTLSSEPSENGFVHTDYFKELQKELEFVESYKKQWSVAPYPVKHVTVDAVVEQSGHILLVRRRSEPGKNLLALPGGHLEKLETLEDGAIRELREETKIKVPEPVLRGSIVNSHTFDDPHRSAIGRVITQAFHIKLTDATTLPRVKGSDDALKAFWVPIGDIREHQLFDDHYHIIQYFLGP